MVAKGKGVPRQNFMDNRKSNGKETRTCHKNKFSRRYV